MFYPLLTCLSYKPYARPADGQDITNARKSGGAIRLRTYDFGRLRLEFMGREPYEPFEPYFRNLPSNFPYIETL